MKEKMKEKMKRGARVTAVWGNRFATVLIVVCLVLICAKSMIQLDIGKDTVTYVQTPFERSHTQFEDSDLFTDILEQQITDITRMCVIRNQMETNGVYNGRKIIDISQFVNRANIGNTEEVTAEYYLDDLIKWGNYGFDYETIHTSDGNKSILYQRYQTVEGKVLSDYAKDDEEYRILVSNLTKAAEELFLNYTEYMKYLDTYDESKSNIIYCYGFNHDGKMEYYSNADEKFYGKKPDEISSKFSKYHRFIVYYPDKMQMSTNTHVNAQDMRTILSPYEYSFQDNSRVWIGVSNEYRVIDLLKDAHDLYGKKEPYFVIFVILLVLSSVFFVFTLRMSTKMESSITLSNRRLKVLRRIDHIPLEADLFVLAILIYTGWALGKRIIFQFFQYDAVTMAVFAGILVFFYHLFLTTIYLSFVRKIKNRRLLKQSIVYWLCRKMKRSILETYNNGNVVVRTWVPYIGFLVVNFLLLFFGWKGVLFAVVLDLMIGTLLYATNKERQNIILGIEKIKEGDFSYKVPTKHLRGDNLQLAHSVNQIGSAIQDAVEKSMKDEKMKADLITNVSHDLKTPLTSIISYVDLIKQEQIENDKIKNYVEVLDAKSQRLKQLTDDLVEASKISSGNIVVQFSRINFVEFIYQTVGEFSEKFEEKNLTVVTQMPEKAVYIKADSRHLFRVVENLYHNVYKYAMEGTRVYLSMQVEEEEPKKVSFSIKNISASPLTVSALELTERFVQGDASRRTEGSGLGLSIAKSLVESLQGKMEIQLDGDLFKAILSFQVME